MQLTPTKGNYIEKIVRDAHGRLVRATFYVYENNGRVKARLIDAVLIEESFALSNKVYGLCGDISQKFYTSRLIFQKKIVSPYFNNNLLFSLGSKPRAPTK